MTDQIANAFGVETTELERAPRIVSPVPATYDEFTKQLVEHRKTDYGTVRDNLLNLLKDMECVVDTVVSEVRSNPSARMIESFSALVKTFAEVNKDLLSLTDKNSETRTTSNHSNEPDQPPVNNVIFIGTSDSLIDQIRSQIR
jgi:hypothetical protein